MAAIELKAEQDAARFGLVVVRNEDRSFNRAFKIAQEDVQIINASKSGMFPEGVTREEWESGLARITGGCLEVGAIVQHDDGSIEVKHDETLDKAGYRETWLRLSAGEYSGKLPAITMAQKVVDVKASAVSKEIIRQETISISAGILDKA